MNPNDPYSPPRGSSSPQLTGYYYGYDHPGFSPGLPRHPDDSSVPQSNFNFEDIEDKGAVTSIGEWLLFPP